MCILCVVQKWSRRVATMLPWVVIPLIVLWAVSQLLPPGFRFEITSPRLACVTVLLTTLFWYEILMPQLSAWRMRRSARMRERKRFEAIEMQKLRRTATRRCRNCLTPYRDQNPGGGKFMCAYCGHISRRPVLDIPGTGDSGISNSGLIGKLWNCGQDWSENGNWGGISSYRGSGFGGEDWCFAEKSYSGVVASACKVLGYSFSSLMWFCGKNFRIGSGREDNLSDIERKDLLSKDGENGGNFGESKGEKARRKAEEKRQARLEKEMLEEEERKQREEVARLVEERRKLRDEKFEAEKEREKGSLVIDRRETERRRLEKRKEKDKGSSKSNSDGEEVERRASSREGERKRDSLDKKNEIERRGDLQKTVNGSNKVSSGTKYTDRVRSSLLSSSKAFNGATFFGKGTAHNSASSVSKVNKFTGSGDHVQTSANRKLASNGDDKIGEATLFRPSVTDLQPQATEQKKSWHQLFSRSSAVSLPSNTNTMYQLNQKHQAEAQSSQLPDQASPTYLRNPMHIGFPLAFTFSPFANSSMSSRSVSPAAEFAFPPGREQFHDFVPTDTEFFEDPCNVPDPVSLLGPVSESLDNFPLDLGTGFVTDTRLERPRVLKNVSATVELSKPSPIESPISRLRVPEERHTTPGQLSCNPKSRDLHTSSLLDESSNGHERGTWQMWGTPPLGQDGLGLVGGPASWLPPIAQNKPNQDDIMHPSTHKAMTSQFTMDNRVLPGTCSPQKVCVGNYCQNNGTFSPLGHGSNGNDLWQQKTAYQPLSGDDENNFPPLNFGDDISQHEVIHDSSTVSEAGTPFKLSPANCWSKDWAVPVPGVGEVVENSTPAAKRHIGGLFSSPDVQSLWSFK
eukprot:TRINITY_DN1802_c0_g2_i1.p1 TRINITY_DN1802_c0_g2~~TRINITY_DN1802_c0_g2_i1.p1  ORF type:complete len:854 (-),score=153.68 TRINITY_DN1802_c0_g2_i1:282-2843(-)